MNSKAAYQALKKALFSVFEDDGAASNQAWLLLEKLLGATKTQLMFNDFSLTHEQASQLSGWIDQIAIGKKPIPYLLGSVAFLDHEILVEQPILIPRVETEYWVNQLIQEFTAHAHKPARILDLCTGSGCIALALAAAFPEALVVGIDKDPAAIALANKNKQLLGIDSVTFLVSDLFEALDTGTFDLIVANPPYIPITVQAALDTSVIAWESHEALFAGHDGLSIIRQIIQQAPRYLTGSAWPHLWIEIDVTHHDAVRALFHQHNFSAITTIMDQYQRNRVVAGTQIV